MVSVYQISVFFHDNLKLIDRGENAIRSSHIQAFSFLPEDEKKTSLSGSVHASMKDKLYSVKVLCNEGEIVEASCTCPKGQDRCHHMAAVLLYSAKNVSSTDKPCIWNATKSTNTVEALDKLFGNSTFTAAKRLPNEDLHWLKTALQPHNLPINRLLQNTEPSKERLVPTFEDIQTSTAYCSSTYKAGFLVSTLAVSEEDIAYVSNITVGQSKNSLWGAYRKGRLTSSNFGTVLKAIKSNNLSTSTLKQLKGEYNLEKIQSVQWGICHESVALCIYKEIKFVEVQPSGLILDKSGILGCSPDGLVGMDTIIEIKCPVSVTNILKAMHDKKWYLLFKEPVLDGILHTSLDSDNIQVFEFGLDSVEFNLKHQQGFSYYNQIQGTMHISNRKKCDVVIWTPNQSVIFSLQIDEDWKMNVEKLKHFYQNVFVHTLVLGP